MSTLNSPTTCSSEPAALVYPPSPPALMIPPPLGDCIENPPAPLTLEECFGDPTPGEVPIPDSPSSPTPIRSWSVIPLAPLEPSCSHQAISSLQRTWHINTRLTDDKIIAAKIYHGKTSVKLVKSTWAKALQKQSLIPQDWIYLREVLVGRRVQTP